MKLFSMIIAGGALLVGLVFRQEWVVLAGALIHFLAGVTDLFILHRDAKLLRVGALEFAAPPFTVRCARRIQGIIALGGLGLVIATGRGDFGILALAGWIIWGGAVACYLVSGSIARDVGGIPLSMGPGGWAVRRDRKGRIRS